MKEITKPMDDRCNHTFTKQDKVTVQILKRVCTNCGQEEVICDNNAIDALTAKKLLKIQ